MRLSRSRLRLMLWVLLCMAAPGFGDDVSGPVERTTALPPTTQPTTSRSAAATTQSAAAVSEADIETLIIDLGADNWKLREAAQAKLVHMGGDAEAVLRRRLASTTRQLEVHDRIQSILAEIAEQRRSGPALITLHAHGAAPKAVFDALFKQAGGEYVTYPAALLDTPGQTVDVDFDKTPFLVALKQTCEKTGLNARHVYDAHRMTLIAEAAAPTRGPSVIEGRVLVSAAGINGSANADWVSGVVSERAGSLTMNVLMEPRLRATTGWLAIDKLEDEHGHSLLLGAAQAQRVVGDSGMLNFEADFAWQARLGVKLPRESTKVAVFEGSVHLLTHTATERAEISDLLKAKDVTRIVGGKRFVLHQVTSDGNTYEVSMTLYRGQLSDAEWSWFRYPYGRFRLVDADGRDLTTSSGGGGGNESSEFTVRYTRDTAVPTEKPGEPVKLIWDLPTETREISVPFVFKDLPLP